MLNESNLEILIANEVHKQRAAFYEHTYPKTKMIVGDIKEKKVFNTIISESINLGIDFLMATPPCQGMSTAGKLHLFDERNQLIYYAIKLINELKPKYALIENIPQQLKTSIIIGNRKVLIPDYIKLKLNKEYLINSQIIDAADYGIPQIRKRSILLLTRKNINKSFLFLSKSEYKKHISLKESIFHLPELDPRVQEFNMSEQLDYFPEFEIKEAKASIVSKWHKPPIHKIRHVDVMKNTPEGKSALFNKSFYPKKKDGTRIKGYKNTYRRQLWNRPAYTVTTYNGAICSHDNVHPGRTKMIDGKLFYSDARVFSIFELMIVMSIPTNWDIPNWANDSLIRHSIGEGLPPLILLKLLNKLNF